ncbi:MAG: polysaccharide pyruvyl transferase family protein [Demequina sp.]
MNVVVIGDIGWRYLYHLGDEAMTEAAIDALRARGINDITLVAGQPEVSEAFYQLPCVSRAGFRSSWTRDRMDDHLSAVTDVLARPDLPERSIYSAIRDCDVVLIAGGGNMNSNDYHLLYERVATKRIAEHFEKPLYVTSQTIGPRLTDGDRAKVFEVVDYARAVGAREPTTAALLRGGAARPEFIFSTLDDATLLTSDDAARTAVTELAGDRPFVVASFTHHGGSMWADEETYHSDIAALVRDVATAHDVDVLLAPHAGSLDPGETTRDQHGNEAIANLAGTDRVRAIRMITAREDVALIERARLSLSTRYHPLVFASAVAAPAVAIANSYYSSIRMRGAMSNVGLQAFVLPTTSLDLVRDAIAEAITPDQQLRDQLAATQESALRLQNRWWDALVDSMRSGMDVDFENLPQPPAYSPRGAWTAANETRVPMFDRYSKTADERKFLAVEVDRLIAERDALRASLSQARDDLDRSRNRKVVRVIDKVTRILGRR